MPVVNLGEHLGTPNVNMISCGGQATIPMVAAVSRVTDVPLCGDRRLGRPRRRPGPGTRANIDEFTQTTARGVQRGRRAPAGGRAIIILNPAEPPITMRNTVMAAIDADADRDAIAESVVAQAAAVAAYVPGYRLVADPQFDDPQPGWDGRARRDGAAQRGGRRRLPAAATRATST